MRGSCAIGIMLVTVGEFEDQPATLPWRVTNPLSRWKKSMLASGPRCGRGGELSVYSRPQDGADARSAMKNVRTTCRKVGGGCSPHNGRNWGPYEDWHEGES